MCVISITIAFKCSNVSVLNSLKDLAIVKSFTVASNSLAKSQC